MQGQIPVLTQQHALVQFGGKHIHRAQHQGGGGKLEGVLYFETATDEAASFHLAGPVQRPVLVELVAEVGGVAVTSQT